MRYIAAIYIAAIHIAAIYIAAIRIAAIRIAAIRIAAIHAPDSRLWPARTQRVIPESQYHPTRCDMIDSGRFISPVGRTWPLANPSGHRVREDTLRLIVLSRPMESAITPPARPHVRHSTPSATAGHLWPFTGDIPAISAIPYLMESCIGPYACVSRPAETESKQR
jgi:hypothetical protein